MIDLGKFAYRSILGFHRIDTATDIRNFKMHVHEGLELVFIISGAGRYLVEGVSYPIQPGDVFITQMAEVHVPEIQLLDQKYERVCLNFTPDCLTETLNSHLLSPFLSRENGTLNRYTKDEISADFIKSCTDRIFKARSSGQACVMSYVIPVLQEIYNAWERKRYTHQEVSSQLPSQIIAYVNKHLFDLTGLEQLEKDLFLSRTHINRIFRSVTGSSLWNYVQIKRLFAAREMLQSGVAPTAAAAKCGYQDYSSFFRAYKKQFGHSPKDDHNRAV